MPIQSFRDADVAELFRCGRSRRWAGIVRVAMRKLDMLNAAVLLDDLRSPPGNRLEALQGDRAGRHSIRVNGQWRLVFRWTEVGPTDVEIVDYH